MKFTIYDIWKIMVGICIAMWVFGGNWVSALCFTVITGFAYGWSSVYRPSSQEDEYYLPEDNPEKENRL